MARDWHETFRAWAKPPSDTEEEKGSRAARMISEAVRSTDVLAGRNFDVYPTGSYRNNTNIRLGSDVDVALVLHDTFFYTLPAGLQPGDVGITPGQYPLADFRRDLGRALAAKFGSDVTPGNKTFDIAGNSRRLPADATPFLLHRAYTGARLPGGGWEFVEGVETRPLDDPNRRIVNWHSHHYDNGVRKNGITNRRFKRVTRILKKMREEMREQGTPDARAAAAPMASFLIECLVYNASDKCFNLADGTYHGDVREVIKEMWNATKDDAVASRLVEVNARKLLFGPHQGWARAQAHAFLLHAWQHAGFAQS